MTKQALAIADLERVYDALALGIDQAPAGKSELFLTKLALLLANEIGSFATFEQALRAALRDL